MNKTSLALSAAVFALTFTACDEKKAEPAPVAPVAQPAVPPAEPAKPAEPAAEPHAAKPVEKKDDKGSDTPAIDAPRAAEAPAEMKGKDEKGIPGADAPAKERVGAKMPPPPPTEAEAPAAAPATTEVQPAKPGRKLPPGVK
jgi:hypothetical protein